jgi:hypothetical protein
VARWSEFAEAAPELASAIQARFAANRHHVLATLRPSGAPRVSGLEAPIRDGELFLAMMADSHKAADLRRDPRFAFHAATIDLELSDGDAKVSGRAVDIAPDDDVFRAFTGSLEESPPGDMALFRADIEEAALVRVMGDELVIDFWRDGEPPRQVRRK